MLSPQDNEDLCRVGPGTVMGDLLREYWLPALRSDELPAPDCPPLRVLLLGEELIAFRTGSGSVGLIQNACPHRGASLFFGRNEEEGLRCVYHGWKFDARGDCVDMPSEPAQSNFRSKVRATAYPTRERGGIVWAYLGPRTVPPELPLIEANLIEGATIQTYQRECNWVQALEGDIDTSHFGFLHMGSMTAADLPPDSFDYYSVRQRAPGYSVVDTEVGTSYGACRQIEGDRTYWRIANFMLPCFSQIPTGVLGEQVLTRAWVPLDDQHTMLWILTAPSSQVFGGIASRLADGEPVPGVLGGLDLLPNDSTWLGRFRMASNARNDYRIDRQAQRRTSFTGITGIIPQDQAMNESMGPIYDRSREHLGTGDAMIIRTRRRLLSAARALQQSGEAPAGVDNPELYAVRSGGVILPRDADWLEATRELRAAPVVQ